MFAIPQPIHRVEGIRALEAAAGPNTPLMERAGQAAAQLALTLIAQRKGPVLILCGPGNNGGDGFVMARHLRHAGRDVVVVFAQEPNKLPPDARAAADAFLQAGGHTTPTLPQGEWALAVDALFGIGLTRPIEGLYADWLAAFNRAPCPRLALDIPSGLDADTGARLGPAACATHTLTFIALKSGLLTLDGPDCAGEIHTDALGLDAAASAIGWVNDPAQFQQQLTARPRNTHKGHFGNVGIIGGAPGMVGAALLAGRAALKTGAGRVYVGCLESTLTVDPIQPELMLRTPDEVIALADTLAIGPGLGTHAGAHLALDRAIRTPKALVLDADALNLIATHPVLQSLLSRREAPSLLTPHPAEAARLLDCPLHQIQQDRLQIALTLAAKFQTTVALKGCGSIIANARGQWWINPTGNPGMASAGMGDVLTGITAALLAQGWPAQPALQGAVWLHGAAGDHAVSQDIGPIGLSASETIAATRTVFNCLIATGRAPNPRT